MSLADTLRRTCSVGPTDSRRLSHAPLAYDGNLVVYAKLSICAWTRDSRRMKSMAYTHAQTAKVRQNHWAATLPMPPPVKAITGHASDGRRHPKRGARPQQGRWRGHQGPGG